MSLTKIGSIGINTGIAFAGVTTIATLNGSDAVLSVGGTVNFVSDVSIGGTVSIAGTLTYEDVTNVDAVGLITARNGIVVGSGITLSKDGDGFFTGVVTATSYAGDGSALTGIDATQIATLNTSVQTTDTGSDGTVKVNTDGSERVRVTSSGNVNIGGNYDETSHPLNVSDSTKPSLALHTGTALRADLSATSGVTSIRSYSNSPFTINIGGSGETEALRIDGSGRLLLGTTTEGHTNGDDLTIATSGNTGITIRSGTSDAGNIYFSDATSGDGEYKGYISYAHNADGLYFATGATNRMLIDSSGDVTVSTGNIVIGTAGKGIDFSAQTATSVSGASATAEVLDHYEEGTFTAYLANVSAPTYEAQGGRYTRIGRMVFCDCTIGVASGMDNSDGSGFQIAGLPFTGSAGGGDTCLFSLGRYTNLLGDKQDNVENIRYTGGGGVILMEGNNDEIAYNEVNSSGYLQISLAFMIA